MSYFTPHAALLIRAGVNIAIAAAILASAALLSRIITNSIAQALTRMLVCIVIGIMLTTASLFVGETLRHVIATVAVVVEGIGIWFFIAKISGRGAPSVPDP